MDFYVDPLYFIFSNTNTGNIADASISIESLVAENVIAYAISDSEGKYQISFSHEAKHVLLIVRSMGYGINKVVVSNQNQTKNFSLQKDQIELQEVLLKNELITRRGDTLNYSVSAFSKEQDRSISDVLKRMPGIEVLSNGKIVYQGTPINKYYIEGLDLLGGRYNLANENLPYKAVAKVQILKNHQPIKLLDSLVFSNKAALNIQLKEPYTLTGQAELGSGFSPLLWDVNLTPILFSKKLQMLTSYQSNNTGDNVASQLQTLTVKNFLQQRKNHAQKKDWLAIQQLTPPNFSEKRWLNNNGHLFSTNFLHQLGNDYSLRWNISYLNDYQQQNGFTRTYFFTPTDTISLFESTYNELYSNSLRTNITLKKNTDGNYLKNNLQFRGFWNSQRGTIQTETHPLTQNLSNHYFRLSNTLKSIFPVGKQLLTLNSYISLQQTPQQLRVRPGQFENLLNDGNAYKNVIQNVDLKTFYTNNSIGFTKQLGYFTVSPKFGIHYETQNLETELFTSENKFLGNQFTNHLNWSNSKTYTNFQVQFAKNNWRIVLNTPLNFQAYRIKDKGLQREQNLNRLTFEPQLSVIRDLNAFWETTISGGLTNSMGSIHQLHYAYILKNYRSLQRIDSPLPESNSKNIRAGISYENPMTSLFGYLFYSFSQSESNLLYENRILPSGATEIHALVKDNTRKHHTISANISKYFSAFNTSVTLSGNYASRKFQLVLNAIRTDIATYNQRIGAEIITDITPWFDVTYKTEFTFSRNKIQNQQHRNNTQRAYQLHLNFHLATNQFLGLNMEYTKNNFFSDNNENLFSDLLYRFSLAQKNIDFELHWTNIFNVANYSTLNLDGYRYMKTTYQLRPSQILLKLRFSF